MYNKVKFLILWILKGEHYLLQIRNSLISHWFSVSTIFTKKSVPFLLINSLAKVGSFQLKYNNYRISGKK